MKNIRPILVLLVVMCLPGCFTAATQLAGPVARSGGISIFGDQIQRGSRVFSGTAAHFSAIESGHLPWAESKPYWRVGAPIDLPFSLLADILILPYTIPAQVAWGDFDMPAEEEKPREDEKETP